MFDLVPLPEEGRVSDDGEAFVEHIRQVHEEVRTAHYRLATNLMPLQLLSIARKGNPKKETFFWFI